MFLESDSSLFKDVSLTLVLGPAPLERVSMLTHCSSALWICHWRPSLCRPCRKHRLLSRWCCWRAIKEDNIKKKKVWNSSPFQVWHNLCLFIKGNSVYTDWLKLAGDTAASINLAHQSMIKGTIDKNKQKPLHFCQNYQQRRPGLELEIWLFVLLSKNGSERNQNFV